MAAAMRLSSQVAGSHRAIDTRYSNIEMDWYDGEFVDEAIAVKASNGQPHSALSLNNPGIKFGANVFSTLRGHKRDLLHPLTGWQAHCDRLTRSINTFSWPMPDWPTLIEPCQQLLQVHPILRITVFIDGQVWISGRDLPDSLADQQRQGVALWVAPGSIVRSLPQHKTGNYLACYLARQQAQQHQAADAILIQPPNTWLETSTANLWAYGDGQWWSPPSDCCLPGIMSGHLQDYCERQQYALRRDPWTPDIRRHFEAIAVCNCVVRLLPVHTIQFENNRLEYDPRHPQMQQLQAYLIERELLATR